MPTAIWWVRRDLRLRDNPALRAALREGGVVLPLFIIDPALNRKPAPKRQAFLFAGLHQLDADLRAHGSRLIVRSGQPLTVLSQLVAESGTQVIYAGEDYSPYARRRDAQVARQLPLRTVLEGTVHHPGLLLKADGTPYTVFTPFSRLWKSLPLPELVAWSPPERFLPAPELPSDVLPDGAAPDLFPPGEKEAQRRLTAFLEGPVYAYAEDRDRLDLEGTSTLSPYLRFGMLSALRAMTGLRQALSAAPDNSARLGCETWRNELIWREFYNAILYYFPGVLREAFNPALRNIPWRDVQGGAAADLQAWKVGRTGYPVVDACMRQLAETGWMHNRGRMIVASFLVKDLLIDWQVGERWFMQQLVDGDPAANNGGWQWTAGVGTDAAPYFRVFNPVRQGKKFDPEGSFIRRWVPELRAVLDNSIHEPWRDGTLPAGYPAPLVDHQQARKRALDAYRMAKANGQARPTWRNS